MSCLMHEEKVVGIQLLRCGGLVEAAIVAWHCQFHSVCQPYYTKHTLNKFSCVACYEFQTYESHSQFTLI